MRPELYLARQIAHRVDPARIEAAVKTTSAAIADRINRQGIEAQIAYLIDDGMPPDQIRALVTQQEAA